MKEMTDVLMAPQYLCGETTNTMVWSSNHLPSSMFLVCHLFTVSLDDLPNEWMTQILCPLIPGVSFHPASIITSSVFPVRPSWNLSSSLLSLSRSGFSFCFSLFSHHKSLRPLLCSCSSRPFNDFLLITLSNEMMSFQLAGSWQCRPSVCVHAPEILFKHGHS